IREVLDTIKFLKGFCNRIRTLHSTDLIQELSALADEVLAEETIKKKPRNLPVLNYFHLEKCDFVLRVTLVEKVHRILQIVYELDAYQAAALAAKKLNLAFVDYNPSKESEVAIEGVFHLFLNKPTGNDLKLDTHENICLLTGVNMSGKSTMMKSVAVSI